MLVLLAAHTPDPGGADPVERCRAAVAIDLADAGFDVVLFAADEVPGAAHRLRSAGVRTATSADPAGWMARSVALARAVIAFDLLPPLDVATRTAALAGERPPPVVAVLSELASVSHHAAGDRPDTTHLVGAAEVTHLLAGRDAAALSACSAVAVTDAVLADAVARLAAESDTAPGLDGRHPQVVRAPDRARGTDPRRRHSQRRGPLLAVRLFGEIGLPDDEALRVLDEARTGADPAVVGDAAVLGVDGPARLAPPLASWLHVAEPAAHRAALARARVALLPRRFGMPQPLLVASCLTAGVPVLGTAAVFAGGPLADAPTWTVDDPGDLWAAAAGPVYDPATADRLLSEQRRRLAADDARLPDATTWVLDTLDQLGVRPPVGLHSPTRASDRAPVRTCPSTSTSTSISTSSPARAPGTGWDGSAAGVRPGQEHFERRLRTGWSVTREAGLHLQFILAQHWPYRIWRTVHEEHPHELAAMAAEAATLPAQPCFSVLLPTWNSPVDLLEEAIASVEAQVWPMWQLCVADDGSTDEGTLDYLATLSERDPRITAVTVENGSGIAAATNAAFATATGDWVALLDHDDVLHPAALWWMARLLGDDPDLDVIYTDEDKLDPAGNRVDPLFKPDWNPDLLLGCNYLNHLTALRADLVRQVGGWRTTHDGSQDHDLLLRITERTDRVGHVARPLYHWRMVEGSEAQTAGVKPAAADAGRRAVIEAVDRRGLRATVEPGLLPTWHRVRWHHGEDPLVSVIIPTRDRGELLQRCLGSLRRTVAHPHIELVIVDNESTDPTTLALLDGLDATVVSYPHRFNYARQMNLGAAAASGSVLLLLNNDTAAAEPGWFDALLEQALRPEVGAVGLRLLRLGRSGAEQDRDDPAAEEHEHTENEPDDDPAVSEGTGHDDDTGHDSDDDRDDDVEVKVQHEGIVLGVGGQALNLTCGPHGVYGANVRDCAAVTAAALMCRTSSYWSVGGFDEQIPVAFNDVDFCLRLGARGHRVVYTPWGELYHAESASRGSLHPEEDEATYGRRWGAVASKRDAFYNVHLDLLDPFVLRL
ncbi:MAG: glycosyltransferase [Acidimicrobiia bacterium]|nr:glycosyltransferase [Acidimicrobiia bacterium]